MILSPKQIGLVIYEVGIWGPGGSKEQVEKWLDVAIAVCLAESGGNTNAKNATSSARGLWQIMVSDHEDKIKQEIERWWGEDGWPGKNIDAPEGYRMPDIFDPRVNTGVAARVYYEAGKSWKPWEAYNTGAYKRHLGHGKNVYAYLSSPEMVQQGLKELRQEIALGRETMTTAAGVLSPVLAQASDPGSLVDKILGFLQSAGVTIGVFIIAAILVILGIWFLLDKPLPPIAKVIKPA